MFVIAYSNVVVSVSVVEHTGMDLLQMTSMSNVSSQATGLGRLKPNILMMGFKKDWRTTKQPEVETYVGVLQ